MSGHYRGAVQPPALPSPVPSKNASGEPSTGAATISMVAGREAALCACWMTIGDGALTAECVTVRGCKPITKNPAAVIKTVTAMLATAWKVWLLPVFRKGAGEFLATLKGAWIECADMAIFLV